MTATPASALTSAIAAAAQKAGLSLVATSHGTDFHGQPTSIFEFAAPSAARNLRLELSAGFDFHKPDLLPAMTAHLAEEAKRLRNPRPDCYVTIEGLPISLRNFSWPFHLSTSGADTFIVHGEAHLEDGTNSPLHALISAVPFGTSTATAQLAINGAATSITLSAPPNPLTFGAPQTITATVAPFAATGSVTFYDGEQIIGSGTLSSGVATVSTDTLSAGVHQITARYLGNSVYNPSLSSPIARTETALPAGAFTAPTNSPFSAGSAPAALVTGDFNHDGFVDMAVVASNGVFILLGNGQGGTLSTIGPIAAGTYPIALATGDFNGDGNLDLAIANFTSSNVTILLGNGAGNFTPSATLATGTGPVALSVLDFNNDGIPDLAVVNQTSNTVSLLHGDGTGNFSLSATLATGSSPESIAVADFNSDGFADLAVTNLHSNSISLFLGSPTGAYSTAASIPAGSSPFSIVTADFNSDGIPDLAVANVLSSGQVTVLLGNGNATFTAAPSSPFSAGTYPYYLATGDFNGDGLLDLAITNSSSNNITVILGQGNGNFTARAGSPISAGATPQSIVVLDSNLDGISDLAYTTSSGIGVLLGALAPVTVSPGSASVSYSATQQNVTLSSSIASNYGTVNSGTVTFTLLTSTNSTIGSPLTSTVSGGTASVSYILPAGLAAGTYTIQAAYSGGGTFASSSATTSLVVSATNTITIASLPSGLTLLVDGVSVTTPATFQGWVPGSAHTVSAATIPQQTGVQYIFGSWSQGGSATQIIYAPSVATAYTATFQLQYFLTTTAVGNGTVSPASSWINANSSVQVSATPASGSTFLGFSGAISGLTNPQTLSMSAPQAVTASFATGSPSLSATISSKVDGTIANERVWTVTLANNGTAAAPNAVITNVQVLSVTGSATVTLSPQMALPISVGAIAAGSSGAGQIRLIFPATTPASRISLALTYSANGGVTTTTQTFNSQFR